MLVYFFEVKRLAPPLNRYSQLEEMLALRKMGASYLDLQTRYGVSKDTIVYLCRKFGLGGKMKPPIKIRRTTRFEFRPTYTEEVINPGKTYAEYLADEKRRCQKRKEFSS